MSRARRTRRLTVIGRRAGPAFVTTPELEKLDAALDETVLTALKSLVASEADRARRALATAFARRTPAAYLRAATAAGRAAEAALACAGHDPDNPRWQDIAADWRKMAARATEFAAAAEADQAAENAAVKRRSAERRAMMEIADAAATVAASA